MMKNLNNYIKEKSAISSGQLTWNEITYQDALDYCDKIKLDIFKHIPNFKENFKSTYDAIWGGFRLRKDMPRITRNDRELFVSKLLKGEFDINPPYSPKTNKMNKFPEFLKGKEAEQFLRLGLEDGDLKDDIIKIKREKVSSKYLNPIQKDVYFDHVINILDDNGTIKKALDVNKDKVIIVSDTYDIIDGHHFFSFVHLVDPEMKVNVLKIYMNTEDLLKLATSFGDAIGNKRNKS